MALTSEFVTLVELMHEAILEINIFRSVKLQEVGSACK